MSQRKGGFIRVHVDGVVYDAKGDATYNLGRPKRDPIIGADAVHGFKETPQVAYVELKFTDRGDLDVDVLVRKKNSTVMLELANGKAVVFRDAWYSAEGAVNTGEGEIDARFDAIQAEEIS